MHNFTMNFDQPLLLLLLIPAIATVIMNYFMVFKRYRNTRNRIMSIAAHTLCIVLAILVLAGVTFEYDLDNDSNELIVLVDMSDTQSEINSDRDVYLRELLNEAQYNNVNVGIVSFGFDQVYAAPLTSDTMDAYDKFLRADLPDTSATDIAAAINYASSLFKHPDTAKILLLSDGVETDEDAISAVRDAALKGIKIDATHVGGEYVDDKIQISKIETPTYYVRMNESCNVTVTVSSKLEEKFTGVTLRLFDNGVEAGIQKDVALSGGDQVFTFSGVRFAYEGLHELKAQLSYDGENESDINNEFCSYYYIQVHDSVLVLEQRSGDSEQLVPILQEKFVDKDVKLVNVVDHAEEVPKSVEELCGYDEVILNNIANADLDPAFVDILYTYVNEKGGSMFTIGGSEGEGEEKTAHAYDRNDLFNTKLQKMLPVEAIDYKPPMGVMIIVDDSGSMSNLRPAAKAGALGCLNSEALTGNDYLGVMLFAEIYSQECQLLSCSNKEEIQDAINNFDNGAAGGSTNCIPALQAAAKALKAEKRINRRHIVFVTDCVITDLDAAIELANNEEYAGITISTVALGVNNNSDPYLAKMRDFTDAWHGVTQRPEGSHDDANNTQLQNEVMTMMKKDLTTPLIREYVAEPYEPRINKPTSPVVAGLNRAEFEDVQLGGYYGVRARGEDEGVEVILTGLYDVPLYAQWQFGAGRVGSFMCDMYGDWSKNFLKSDVCKTFIFNAMSNIMPTSNIEETGVKVGLRQTNYINEVYVSADLEEGERLTGRIEYEDENGNTQTVSLDDAGSDGLCYVTSPLGGGTRATFVLKRAGSYRVIVEKTDKEGNVKGMDEAYMSFAFSKEYDIMNKGSVLEDVVEQGGGKAIDISSPLEVLEDFVANTHVVYDPRILFISIALVLFLFDVFVRKFKFRWPHEIIRARRAAKEENNEEV